MSFDADILVVAPGGRIHLVAETKPSLSPAEREASAAALKHYMVSMRCPVGLLVTRETLGLFRDRYTDYTAESVEEVGEFMTTEIESLRAARDPVELEQAVRDWLEDLPSSSARSRLPTDLREAIEEYVLPALEEGEVRASGPRPEHRTTT